MERNKLRLSLLFVVVLLFGCAVVAFGDWDPCDPYKMHWPQLPDPCGWDIAFCSGEGPTPLLLELADDWLCTKTGPVSDIHFWVSWKNDLVGTIESVMVCIYSNNPNGFYGWSEPNVVLWSRYFPDGTYTIRPYGSGQQGWYDPNTGMWLRPDHNMYYQINITDINDPFIQEEGEIYWLGIHIYATPFPTCKIGWKTAIQPHFMDDAVWRVLTGGPWMELRAPMTYESLDLSFVITSEEVPEGKLLEPHTKWSQPPIEIDPASEVPTYCGWDEQSHNKMPSGKPWKVVADDYRCIGSMPVTSIHWWGSFYGWEWPWGQGLLPPVLPAKWWIGFWSNVPAFAPPYYLPYSYPDMLRHSVTIPAARVDFNEVGSDEYYGYYPNDICYQYHVDLNSAEVFWQDDFNGVTYDNTYWISIVAEYNAPTVYYPWGWKTRPWHWMDDAVTFRYQSKPVPPSNPDPCQITPIKDPMWGESFDMAFELDTDPNYIKWEQIYNGREDWWLMGWWKFDEGSGSVANDSSGNQRNGTIYGNPTWQTGSPVGNSGYLKFDGLDDYVDVNYISQGAFMLPIYTVSMWFRVDGNDPNEKNLISVTDSALGHGMALSVNRNVVGTLRYLHRHPFSQYGSVGPENIYTTTTYGDGLWHHAAAVRASDNSRLLYVDGQQVGSDSNVTTAFDAPVSVILGALFSPGYPSGGRFWNGAIDDVRIYNRALSATEVAELYTGSETSNWPHYEDVNSIYKFYEPEKEQIVADDWRCLRRTPVTAVVWWGSYIGYGYEACQGPMPRPVRPDKFRLMMWTDVAADPCDPCSYSHPGEVIWQYDANKYDEVLVGYDKHPEGEPNEPVFRYSVRLPEDKWFHQPAYNEVFWLSVQAVYDINMPDYAWGWTNHKHLFNDDAVAGYRNPTGGEWVWEELYDQTDASEDMSFMLFTDPALCSTCANYNCDARVNFVDFADFADDWRWVGPAGGYNNSDLDCNGVVDFKDVGIFCLQWLEYCP